MSFNPAFSNVDFIASRSTSTARTCFAPNFKAAMERMPLPQPTSITSPPGLRCFSSKRIQSCVVGWVPVPKAIAGLIRIIWRGSPCFGSCQAGRTSNFSPTRMGEKCSFQAFIQFWSLMVEYSGLGIGTIWLRCQMASSIF